MKKIVIIRHAESPIKPGAVDKQRELSDYGVEQAKLLGVNLRCRLDDVDEVVCSTAERTCQTLTGFASALPRTANISYEDSLYNASANEIIERVNLAKDSSRGILIIAHNPGVSDILRMVAPESGHHGHTPASVAYYYSIANKWGDVAFANMKLKFFMRS